MGDFGAGRAFAGERGRLGTLDVLEEPPGVNAAGVVGSRNGDWSPCTDLGTDSLGGDSGGWTVTEGAFIACVVSSGGRVEGSGIRGDLLSETVVFGFTRGLSFTITGLVGVEGADGEEKLEADMSMDGLKFRKRSGFGAGDRGLDGG